MTDAQQPEYESELAGLIQTLQDTHRRIRELTGGEVDAVMGPAGEPVLLPEAQELLLRQEHDQRFFATQRASILDAIPAHIALIDRDGAILAVNESWRRFGQANLLDDSNFSVGQNYLDVCDASHGQCSEEAADVAAGIRAVLAGEEETFSIEYPCHSPDERRWFRLMVTPLHLDHPGGAVVMHVDITDRMVATEALRKSDLLYRRLFFSSPQPMFVYEKTTLRILAVNDASVAHYGYSIDEFLSMTIEDLHAPDVHGALRQTVKTLAGRLRHPGVWPQFKKDGSVVDMDITTHDIDYDGRDARLVLAVDVTERLRAEARIAEQAALLEKASDAIFVCDMENAITYWNSSAEKIYGWTRAEAVGRKTDELMYTGVEIPIRPMEKFNELGEWAGEMEQRTRSGDMVIVHARWTLLLSDSGQPKTVICINTDITERKKLEQQFLRAQRLESVGTLAGGIAHDINNVLAPILMSVELLSERVSDKEGRELLQTVQRSAERGADLVRQVLGFSRGIEGERRIVNPVSIVQDVLGFTRETFPKNVNISFVADKDVWPIFADPTQLNQVLMNLCVNARDAMPDGGEIRIAMKNETLESVYEGAGIDGYTGPHVLLSVEDTGCGIPKEIQDRIFEPFFTTKAVGKGTGLGLSTSFRIVRDHGGFINLYSEPNRGSTFKLYLPARPAAEVAAHLQPGDDTLPVGHGETVLLVDDEPSILFTTRKTLERYGYRVLTAGNGDEALTIFEQHSSEIALLLTDMSMPGMDGPTLIEAIHARNTALPIVASSGFSARGPIAQALERGVRHKIDYFARKPYSAHTLLHVLRQVLDRAAAKAPHSAADAPESTGGKAPTILIVDDEHALLALSARGLRAAGYTVLTATTAEEAIEIAEGDDAIELVITDNFMPGMNGVQLIATMGRRFPDTRFILISGDHELMSKGIALEGKVLDVVNLAKPFSLQELQDAVERALA